MSKYRVRKMQGADVQLVFEWRNHPGIRKFMYTQHEISFEEHSAWFDRASSDDMKHLLIFEINEVPTGFVNFTYQNCARIAEWGFYLSPGAHKGAGKILGETALGYGFNELNLHKVCGEALDFNERSICFHQKLGFKIEGSLRDQFYDGQHFHTVHYFGLLRTEWSNAKVG